MTRNPTLNAKIAATIRHADLDDTCRSLMARIKAAEKRHAARSDLRKRLQRARNEMLKMEVML